MYSSRMKRDVALFVILFLAGAATANILFVCLSIVVLLYIALALLWSRPADITVAFDGMKRSAWTGDVVTLAREIRSHGGIGIIAVDDDLPGHFRLEEGNDFHVFAKGFGPFYARVDYSVCCTKRGVYRPEAGRAEAVHFSGLEQTWLGSCEREMEFVVRPRPSSLRRLRDPRVTARIPMPMGARHPIGVATTDFKEIREYRDGDQFRHINWKATAKREGTMDSIPFVNDFEKEGRKTVWIFLDAREWMRTGSTIENAFEYAIQATLGISQFYLSRNCGVGVSFYNCHDEILPESGRRQSFRIARQLITVETVAIRCEAGREVTLAEAVESIRWHLHGISPFFIVVTMIGKDNAADLVGGIRTMWKYSPRDTRPQIMVLHVQGYELALDAECGSRARHAGGSRDRAPCPGRQESRRLRHPLEPGFPEPHESHDRRREEADQGAIALESKVSSSASGRRVSRDRVVEASVAAVTGIALVVTLAMFVTTPLHTKLSAWADGMLRPYGVPDAVFVIYAIAIITVILIGIPGRNVLRYILYLSWALYLPSILSFSRFDLLALPSMAGWLRWAASSRRSLCSRPACCWSASRWHRAPWKSTGRCGRATWNEAPARKRSMRPSVAA